MNVDNILKFKGPTRNESGQLTVAAHEHCRAILTPGGFSGAIGDLLTGLALYADTYRDRYHSPVGHDGVLGPAWEQIALGIRALLNGETGGLDCGSLDSNILDLLKENGVDTSRL